MLHIRLFDPNIINSMNIGNLRDTDTELTINQKLFNDQLELLSAEFNVGSIFDMSDENNIYVYTPISYAEFNKIVSDKFESNFTLEVSMCRFHYCNVLMTKTDETNHCIQKQFCVIHPDFIKLISSMHDTSVNTWTSIRNISVRNRLYGAAAISMVKYKFKNAT